MHTYRLLLIVMVFFVIMYRSNNMHPISISITQSCKGENSKFFTFLSSLIVAYVMLQMSQKYMTYEYFPQKHWQYSSIVIPKKPIFDHLKDLDNLHCIVDPTMFLKTTEIASEQSFFSFVFFRFFFTNDLPYLQRK